MKELYKCFSKQVDNHFRSDKGLAETIVSNVGIPCLGEPWTPDGLLFEKEVEL